MFKHTRVFVTLTKQIHNSAVFSATVNNNFVIPTPALSKITLNALTCNITKLYCSKAQDSFDEFEDDSEEQSPSVRVQKKLQAEAQEKLNAILDQDPEKQKFYKILELEVDVLRQSGEKVPEEIKPMHWLQLINYKSQFKRRRYLSFLWINNIKRRNAKLKKKEAALLREKVDKKEEEETHLTYGLSNNTMFHRIYKTTMNDYYNKKLINAMLFGEKLVMDCGFESKMSQTELSSCAKQLMFSFVANRDSKDPFELHLCNLDLEGELMKRLRGFFPTIDDPGYPLNYTSNSYLELFPKEKLVYLTPHTNNVMQKYDPDKIYIIGSIVDKGTVQPYTLAKAKEEGLEVAKFPLDSYLEWKSGSKKALNLNHCVEIMRDIKETGDWNYAFRAIPIRKISKSFPEYTNPRISKFVRNVEPKFQSAEASHVPDVSYQRLKHLKYNK